MKDLKSASVLPAGGDAPRFARRLPFFYGWVIVLVSFWSSMLTSGITTYGFSVFMRFLSADLGWSRGAISGVALVRTIASMAAGPVLGKYADRPRGPQVLSAIGALLAGGSLILVAFAQEIWQFYLLFGVLWGVAMVTLGGLVLGPAVVSKWFERKRGRALAIATMGISAGGIVTVPLTSVLINLYGWRGAWAALGIIMLATVFPMGLFLMRRQPEDVGLLPDGDSPDDAARRAAHKQGRMLSVRGSFTNKQAFRSRPFWVLTVVQTLTSLVLSSVLMHQVAYVQDKGFGLVLAVAIGTLVAVFAGISKVPAGLLAERIPVRYLITGAYLLSGGALWLLITSTSGPMLYVYSVLYGLGVGSGPVLRSAAWASYFGRANLGSILGVTTLLTQWTGGIGPVFAGLMYDMVGSYDIAFMVFSGSLILAALSMLFAGPPKEPDAEEKSAPAMPLAGTASPAKG